MRELEYPFDSEMIRRQSKKLKKELLKQENLLPKKVAILSGSTIGHLRSVLEVFLLNQGIQPTFYEGQYNNYYEEAVFSSQDLLEFKPDVVYIHTSVKNIMEWPTAQDTEANVTEKIELLVSKFERIWDSIQEKTGCLVIQNNFEMLPYRIMGNMDRVHVTGRQYFVQRVNARFLEEMQKRNNIFLNDLHYLSAYYGLEKWFDDSSWYAFKYPFSPEAIPMVAHSIANIVKSYFGKNKKAIIADLDNTLWKGVIGDDGVEGIELGIETPEGMMYVEFQEYLKNVRDRGILLNICSKNESNAAELGFRHPSSGICMDDCTLVACNWERKSKNIINMSQQLNLGTDSFVFIDDNPAEQEEVRNHIPNIQVLPITDVSEMRKILDQSGYFEITNYSDEDRMRNRFYKANVQRSATVVEGSYTDYLLSLDMRAEYNSVNIDNIDRVTQLINKTNQFNLTGLRLGKAEVEFYMKNNVSVCGTLYDKFGNNGLVSVILGDVDTDNVLEIMVWIMSCRVFKRHFEYAMFDHLVEICKQRGIRKIVGKYIPTNKNIPVADLYKTLQFTQKETREEMQIWEYEIPNEYANFNEVISIS